MRIDQRELEYIGKPLAVYRAPSQSMQGQFHYQMIWESKVDCTCTGFRVRGYCWHTDKLQGKHLALTATSCVCGWEGDSIVKHFNEVSVSPERKAAMARISEFKSVAQKKKMADE